MDKSSATHGRRKNLSFKAKGADPFHDVAVGILDRLGRGGICNYVAAAIVYYTHQLAAGAVAPEFIRGRHKVLFVNDFSAHSVPCAASAGKPQTPTMPASPPEPKMLRAEGESSPGSEITPDNRLPHDLLHSLVFGFGDNKKT